MTYEEALRLVFPMLKGRDLATCMRVCKRWRDIAEDDYFWKCLCDEQFPSICKRSTPLPLSYRELFQMFYKRRFRSRPQELSFKDLEFYIDIWAEDRLVFSEVVPGSVLPGRIQDLPPGVFERLSYYEHESPCYKLMLPLESKFSILSDYISLSVLLCRRDTNQFAFLCEKFENDYYTYSTGICPKPLVFAPNIVSTDILDLFVDASLVFYEDEEVDGRFVNVVGITLELRESEFVNTVRDHSQFLSLLHMLDWD